ncbi:annexin-2 receptor [Loxodonta africana]|uniref:annexin-2 receptor n=1 Tax=Loxodonta africana TaxID=9785 RepID=UPI0030CD2AC0
MKQHFPDCVKQAWDSADDSPEALALPFGSSEDSGPWPLPFYPKLGEPSPDSLELLSSPPWRLHWVYSQNGLSDRAQSTLEGSSALLAQDLWPGTQTPEASPGDVDPVEEPDRRRWLWPFLQDQPPCAGDTQLDSQTPDSPNHSERRRPPATAWWRHPRVFAGCWEWIRRVFPKPWGCCR